MAPTRALSQIWRSTTGIVKNRYRKEQGLSEDRPFVPACRRRTGSCYRAYLASCGRGTTDDWSTGFYRLLPASTDFYWILLALTAQLEGMLTAAGLGELNPPSLLSYYA